MELNYCQRPGWAMACTGWAGRHVVAEPVQRECAPSGRSVKRTLCAYDMQVQAGTCLEFTH